MATNKMKRKQHSCVEKILLIVSCLVFTIGIHASIAFPEQDKQVRKWSDGGVLISLNDYMNLPGMVWPQTLLEYPVDFTARPVIEGELQLVDQISNQAIPFQLTKMIKVDGKIKSAVLCFLSDLPSGAKKSFKLALKADLPGLKMSVFPNAVSVLLQGKEVIISNGLLNVKIPAPGVYNQLISPIVQFGSQGKWLGHSVMPANLQLKKMEVREVEKGALLAEYLIDYQFEGGKSFQLRLSLASSMEYLETEESMLGFKEADSLSWKLVWDNFNPEIRYCPNRPGAPSDKTKRGYGNFAWEPIGGSDGNPSKMTHPNMPYDQRNQPNGMLPFKIAPYHNWMTWWRLPLAAFWNEKTGQSIGLFIKDFEKWVDPAYPVWGSKDNLSVHFFYKNKEGLSWSMPLVEGKRSLALTIYDHQKDIQISDQTNEAQVYVDYLRRWYGWISLNKTKDWILDYKSGKPAHPLYFSSKAQDAQFNTKNLLNDLKRTVGSMARASERGRGPTPVGTRTYYENITPTFENAESTLSEQDYRQARAYYLFMTYIFMDEALMPMRNMLSGHPNFLADIKGVPAMAAFLFPDHPQAKDMADHFEKSVALNLRYHVRPDEPAWEAKGGRWTENLACYTWAFLRPTLKTSFLLHYFYDGKNRMLQPNVSLYGDWLLNSLTSPQDNAKGRRTYPPQGAHSRILTPSNMLFTLGQELYYYDPLLAEHIFWVSTPEDRGFENKIGKSDSWDSPAKGLFKNPGGTNPHLKSAKYTGYGFNLRQNFGMPDEMYVHLQQIDEGPNYRWGRAAKGGNGLIYYYADGKQYSHNGIEDVGDAPFGDTERCTNFGVKKDKSYRCIGDYRSVGTNDLTEPLYDFGFAQFASIEANGEAAPQYKSRSVLMSGNDYILIFDDVKDNSVEARLSWFVGKDDAFPFIHQMVPGVKGMDVDIQPSNTPYHKDTKGIETKGRYFDGKGDFLTFVTHRESIKPVLENGAYRVAKPDGATEWVLRSDKPLVYAQNQFAFEGTAGIIKQSANKKTVEAALFQGKKIGISGLTAEFVEIAQYAGMSLKNTNGGYAGVVQVRKETTVQFSLKSSVKGLVFYLDGAEVVLSKTGENSYTVKIPAGKHDWQWSDAGLIPGVPTITRSVSGANTCDLEWTPVSGATSYLVQNSTDGGIKWNNVADVNVTKYKLTGLAEKTKIHVRVLAKGKGGVGEPSGDYPVYTGIAKPHAPEGLIAVKNGSAVSLTWGQVLGSDQYVLYQREKGSNEFKKIYSGSERIATVKLADGKKTYEFYVTATNGNGESPKSIVANTDEKSILNWYPIPGEVFRRDTESQENGYDEYNPFIEEKMPVLKYPFQTK
ncbi:MAG: fibronectin type III domain-containing protein [Bacteroidales bacterium]|nr:fibronectin type III domain-containing protein [Bacteroidales bacterium]